MKSSSMAAALVAEVSAEEVAASVEAVASAAVPSEAAASVAVELRRGGEAYPPDPSQKGREWKK
jgi:hypothetical protein